MGWARPAVVLPRETEQAVTDQTVTNHLQAALVDLADLAQQAKHAHWDIHGPHIRSVHLQLDDENTDLPTWANTVAERMAAMGTPPDGRADTVASSSEVDKLDGGTLATDKVIRQFEDRLQAASDRLKATLEDLEADLLSQDIIIEIATG